MIQLRPYQIRILDATWAAMQHKLNVLIVAPCAAGKTVLFSKITQRLLRENSAFRVLILVDREILVTQSRDKLHSIAPELSHEVGIVCSSVTTTKELDKRVTIASRQTLINCMEQFAPVQMCIVDEAHLMSIPREDKPVPDQFAEIVCKLREYNPNMRLVGCTASPYRLGGGYIHGDQNKPGSRPYFDQVDAEVSTKEMLAAGYLAPLVGRANTGSTMQSDLKNISIVGGEYNLGQISSMMCKSTHVQSCISSWREYAWGRKKTLVFCTTIEHSETVAAAFCAAGIPSVAIHSKLTPVEESIRMTALESGTMQVFTSVAKLTTGLDITDLDCGILARPTKSTALYKQIVGRFQRLAEGKTDALIIDLVGATTEFGTDMDNLKVNVPRDASGETPFKICPGENENGTVCGQSVHASLRYCPHCSFAFPVDEAVEAKIGKLEKVKFNEIPEPEPYTVSHVSYEVHESRNTGKHLIKVTYQCGQFSKFNEWICMNDHYSGYAVTKAEDWWKRRSWEPFPQNCEEFIFLSDTLINPDVVMVVKDGKFDRVVECLFIGDKTDDEFESPPDEFQDQKGFCYSDEVPF